jgi:NADH dehydrogenase
VPAWLLWRAYYLAQMPTLGRKVRLFVEWTWGMFFPADITHLRFARSGELGDDRRPPESSNARGDDQSARLRAA